ncbi:hypothetical protein C8R47DRAFT_1204589 [Mycena vitilis]|nr:hypothetical protein C8R47DRAFT_1204589 [Mycena vitilis]
MTALGAYCKLISQALNRSLSATLMAIRGDYHFRHFNTRREASDLTSASCGVSPGTHLFNDIYWNYLKTNTIETSWHSKSPILGRTPNRLRRLSSTRQSNMVFKPQRGPGLNGRLYRIYLDDILTALLLAFGLSFEDENSISSVLRCLRIPLGDSGLREVHLILEEHKQLNSFVSISKLLRLFVTAALLNHSVAKPITLQPPLRLHYA